MFQYFKELLSEFNAHRVRYLMVGGCAVSFYAEPRATKDLDILISPDLENSRYMQPWPGLARWSASSVPKISRSPKTSSTWECRQ